MLLNPFSRAALGAAFAVAALTLFGFASPAAAHGTHYDCQIHGFRPYPHRHVDPGAATVTCDRPAITGRYATAAQCKAAARSRGGRGPLVNGTMTESSVPIGGRAPAHIRAAAMNQACSEALQSCEQFKYERRADRAVCFIVDRYFGR